MKRLFLILVCGVAQSASAADFRALNFGEPCKNVRDLEKELGSTFNSAHPEMGTYTFRGTHLNQPVEIGYTCRNGLFESGSYIFVLPSSREATDLYAHIKDKLTYELGEPETDFDSQEFRQKLHQLGETSSGQNEYTCIWEDKRRRIHLHAYGPRDGKDWKTSISYVSNQEIQQAN